MRTQQRTSSVIRLAALLLITIGMSIGGSAHAPQALSSQEIDQQRTRLQALAAPAPVPLPLIVAAPAPASVEPQEPRTLASHAPVPALSVAFEGQLDPGDVVAPEPSIASEATPSPAVDMPPPSHITIPAVGIDTDVVEVAPYVTTVEDQLVQMWQVADWAAGHHVTTAAPGEGGNIVIAGHDDVRGEVFRGLHDIEIGAEVHLSSSAGTFTYVVQEVHLRRERGVPLAERLAAGQFMAPMPEERLTLITCWPYGIDDHRLIVVAKPLVVSP